MSDRPRPMLKINLFTDPDVAKPIFLAAQQKAGAVFDFSDDPVVWRAVRIPQGTASGASSVVFQLELKEEGRVESTVVIVQTTLALLDGLVAAFHGADARDADLAQRSS